MLLYLNSKYFYFFITEDILNILIFPIITIYKCNTFNFFVAFFLWSYSWQKNKEKAEDYKIDKLISTLYYNQGFYHVMWLKHNSQVSQREFNTYLCKLFFTFFFFFSKAIEKTYLLLNGFKSQYC